MCARGGVTAPLPLGVQPHHMCGKHAAQCRQHGLMVALHTARALLVLRSPACSTRCDWDVSSSCVLFHREMGMSKPYCL